jgi:cytochrome P450
MTSGPAENLTSPFLDEDFQKNAYPAIARLREDDPVHWVPGLNFWFVTRHDDVRRLFTADDATPDRRVWEHYVAPPEGTFMRWVSDNGLFSLPPKEHARVRRLVSAAFTPRAVARMADQVREVVVRFAAPLRGRTGVVDLMQEFTDPVPNAVISRITGVPPAGDDEVRFRELAQVTIQGFFSFGDESLMKRAEQAFLELSTWVRELAKQRSERPQEDLVSDLVQARDRGDRMSTDEIVVMVTGLIGAGSETTALGGMLSIMTLLQHPEVTERLRAERALLPNAVDEILRFGFGGPGGLPRYAVRDFELRGKTIRKGQMLMLSFGGANRDPSVYPDPDRLDIERDVKELTLFGHGPHYCLGAHLARTELRCMLDGALDFLPPGAQMLEDLIEFTPMGVFKRPQNFPVDFGG